MIDSIKHETLAFPVVESYRLGSRERRKEGRKGQGVLYCFLGVNGLNDRFRKKLVYACVD